ncbi:unnamed protein product [Ixodes pacificus]
MVGLCSKTLLLLTDTLQTASTSRRRWSGELTTPPTGRLPRILELEKRFRNATAMQWGCGRGSR